MSVSLFHVYLFYTEVTEAPFETSTFKLGDKVNVSVTFSSEISREFNVNLPNAVQRSSGSTSHAVFNKEKTLFSTKDRKLFRNIISAGGVSGGLYLN